MPMEERWREVRKLLFYRAGDQSLHSQFAAISSKNNQWNLRAYSSLLAFSYPSHPQWMLLQFTVHIKSFETLHSSSPKRSLHYVQTSIPQMLGKAECCQLGDTCSAAFGLRSYLYLLLHALVAGPASFFLNKVSSVQFLSFQSSKSQATAFCTLHYVSSSEIGGSFLSQL